EQYNGGEVFETTTGTRLVATFMSLSETVTTVTDAHGLNTAMIDLTLFFISGHQQHGGQGGGGGGGGRGRAPEVIRLQGAVDFEGQQPPTAKDEKDIQQAIGSVSAASPQWAHLIGHQFRLMNLNQPGTTAKLEID
ncbi:MAG TPA: hypothetical protein VHT91_13575, partial [Kofleriaceae bacterium]|nr:hypothetical protein [Kofleriaceae bacterium]